MEPLSVAASIIGLLTASIEVRKRFAAVITAYDYAQTVHDEIHNFRFVLFRLDKYIHSDSMNVARASMIDLDQVVTVLVGCICIFSELEREVKRLLSWPEGRLRRMRWTMAKSSLVDLVQRLQNHKATILSMLPIINGSQDEALSGMYELEQQVAELVRINAEMARKLDHELATSGSASLSSGASIADSVMTTGSSLSFASFASARTEFRATLNNSRVYRRSLLGLLDTPSLGTEQGSTPSIQQAWSILSGISVSEALNNAVYSMPISLQELNNLTWHTTSSMPESQCLFTTSFAEGLKKALKQNDVRAANTVANYIPWNIVLNISAVYPKLTADPLNSPEEPLDCLTLFRLWLQCGGNADAKDQSGQSAIMKALEDQDWGLFKLLVENMSDINSSWNSKTALHLVSGEGGEKFVLGLCDDIKAEDETEITPIEAEDGTEKAPIDSGLGLKRGWAAMVLLQYGASINDRDEEEETALHHASRSGHWELIEILLDQGADIKAKNSKEMTALHLAAVGRHQDAVDVLVSHGADVGATTVDRMTALHFAAAGGITDVVERLLNHAANVKARSSNRMTALHSAAAGGQKDVVEVLLGHGADIEARNSNRMTPLHCSASGGHKEAVEALLDHGADIEATHSGRMTALHSAAADGHGDVVEVLLNRGASIKPHHSSDMSALHSAAAAGHKDVVEVILNHGADIEATNKKGMTALHSAVAAGHKDVIEVLVTRGADIEAKNSEKKTALNCAAAGGQKDVIELLLSHGADTESRDSNWMTALHSGAADGHTDVVEVLLSHTACIEAKDYSDSSALHSAAGAGHKNVVEVLLRHGADVEARKCDWMTALHSAAAAGHKGAVEALLCGGADIEAKHSGQMTALHSASAGGHKDVVEVLLSKGADMRVRNSNWMTAQDLASAAGHKNVMEVFSSDTVAFKPRNPEGKTTLT